MLKSLEGLRGTGVPKESAVDLDRVPSVDKKIIAARLAPEILAFYNNPENVRAFNKWRLKRAKKKGDTNGDI